jgi:hypothetical protein
VRRCFCRIVARFKKAYVSYFGRRRPSPGEKHAEPVS